MEENVEEFLNYPRKIAETLLGKTEVIGRWWCWYYIGILENFSELISMKLGKN